MPIFSSIRFGFNEGLVMSAACVLLQMASDPARNDIIVTVTYQDGTPVTGLKSEDFLVAKYEGVIARPQMVPLLEVFELTKEIPSIDFKGVYRITPDELEEAMQGQIVYVVKVNATSPSNPFTRYIGHTAVSVAMEQRH